MNWLLVWKLVLATATLIVTINFVTVAAKTARDAIQEWKAPRGELGK